MLKGVPLFLAPASHQPVAPLTQVSSSVAPRAVFVRRPRGIRQWSKHLLGKFFNKAWRLSPPGGLFLNEVHGAIKSGKEADVFMVERSSPTKSCLLALKK